VVAVLFKQKLTVLALTGFTLRIFGGEGGSGRRLPGLSLSVDIMNST
jgi:hypothetical protein